MKINKIKWIVGLFCAAALFLTITGCEDDGDTNIPGMSSFDESLRDSRTLQKSELDITPAAPSVATVGQQIAFRVAGGKRPYTWAVSTAANGTIAPDSTSDGYESVVYTCLKITDNTLTCKDADGRVGYVEISGSAKTLSVTPATGTFPVPIISGAAAVTPNLTIQFTGSGGVSPYEWTDSHPSIGDISTGGLYSYTNHLGSNTMASTTVQITLKDSLGSSVNATITFK